MKDDPEVSQILNRVRHKAINIPRYEFDKVNFSLILMRLAGERVSPEQLSERIGVKPGTIKKWRLAVSKPRCRMSSDKLIDVGVEYLMPDKMAECGVYTDEYKLQQMGKS